MRTAANSEPMSDDPDLLEHYDFTGGVRGKYAGGFDNGYAVRVEHVDGSVEETRLVCLPPDIAAALPTDDAVHVVLREWLCAAGACGLTHAQQR